MTQKTDPEEEMWRLREMRTTGGLNDAGQRRLADLEAQLSAGKETDMAKTDELEDLDELEEEEAATEEAEAQELDKALAKPKKANKKTKKATKPAARPAKATQVKATEKPAPEGIGPKEVAEAAGIQPVELRRFLRAHPELVEGHEARGRYQLG